MKKIAMIAGTVILSSLVAHNADAKVHTVKEGESLWTIAEKYNTTITKIQKINKLDSELILPNQKLEVLVNGKYKVQKGDTLEKIAKKFDVKVSQIKKLNHIKSDEDLKVGKAIKIERAAKNVEAVKTAVAPVTSAAAQVKPVQQKAAVAQTSYKVADVQPEAVAPQHVEVKTETPVQQAQPVQQAAPVQQAQPVQQARTAVQTTSASPASNSGMDAHLKLIAQRESGGNPSAVNPAGYYGLFQFSPSTWAAVGGTGNPADASVDEQWKRARILYETAGASQWSTAY